MYEISETILKGTSQQTLVVTMNLLGIKGYDEGGRIPINERGNSIVEKLRQTYHLKTIFYVCNCDEH